jgi:putative tricarboxylic transport membrane protein
VKKLLTIILIVTLLLGGLTSVISLAADYPEKEIEWILWSNPGGGTDITARTVGIPLRKLLGQPLVIVNMSGGSGARAITYTQGEKADGYTLLFITNTLITTIERKLVDYKLEDFMPVFMLNDDPQVIAVSAKSDIGNITDLIVSGKKKSLKWGLTHLGGNDHVAIHAFAKKTDVKYDPVVYQSGGEVMVAALGGVIDVFISNPSEIMGQVESGDLRVIASMSEKRLSILPEVPTLKEKGYDVTFGTWRGVAVKKGTDPEIIKTLEELFYKAADTNIYREFLKNNGMDFSVKKAEEFEVFMSSQYEVFSEGIKEIGLVN